MEKLGENKTVTVITREMATKEITGWLDQKKISPTKRETKKDSIESLICAIMDGDLTMSDNGCLVQVLKFPAETEKPVKQLTYKQRIRIDEVKQHIIGNKIAISDFDGRVVCYIQALTGEPFAVCSKLETTDGEIAQAIAVFFM